MGSLLVMLKPEAPAGKSDFAGQFTPASATALQNSAVAACLAPPPCNNIHDAIGIGERLMFFTKLPMWSLGMSEQAIEEHLHALDREEC